MRQFLVITAIFLIFGSAEAAPTPETIASEVLTAYVAAWDRADAAELGHQFTPDGDFINPWGTYARGPREIEGFYQIAFAHGYAGSHGSFALKLARRLAPGVIAVDGEWSIAGAHQEDGSARPPEQGLALAILVETADGWRVALLREQTSAQKIRR